MRHALTSLVLSLSLTALAQEPSAPPVMPAEEPAPALPGEFLDRVLRVDVKNQITEGRAQRPVTHLELFERTGRADLVEQSRALASRRTWLLVSAGALLVAGGITGGVLIGTGPVLASPACESDVRVYNEVCVPRANAHNISGTAVIAGSAAVALLLGTLALWSDPRVLDRDQTAAVVSSYNAQLARTLRRGPSGLKLQPVITPEGAALTASLRF
ncbi:MAG: hypothetical protein ACOZQL_13490 [Myxococcota bacterium]